MCRWAFIIYVAIIFGIDQFIKILAEYYLALGKSVTIIPGFFNLTLAYNSGAAFSFLSSAGGWQRWFFIGVAMLVVMWAFYWVFYSKKINKLEYWSLVLLVGGAMGNLWDRLQHGWVIDYLDFYLYSYHWPIFNFADACIVVSLLLLTIVILFPTIIERNTR